MDKSTYTVLERYSWGAGISLFIGGLLLLFKDPLSFILVGFMFILIGVILNKKVESLR